MLFAAEAAGCWSQPKLNTIKSRIAHYQTPVKNLLLGGHWSEYGGGLPVAVRAGSNAALLILKETVPAAYQSLRDLMEGGGGAPISRRSGTESA